MKRSKILTILCSIIMLFTASEAFADQPYRGNAKHRSSLRDISISRADDTYEDLTGDEQDTDKDTVSISFTSDMERNMDLFKKAGTYSRNEHAHYPRAFMLDLGNYTDSYPYDLVFGQAAPGLRMMGAAYYDIVGMGPSELDQGSSKISSMLGSAVKSKEDLPYLTVANVSGTDTLERAYRNYGVNDYQDLNKYGTDIAVFTVVGKDAFDSTSHTNLTYKDAVSTARDIVREIKKDEDYDMIICIVNNKAGSKDQKKSLEREIANKVSGIDMILSGGSTTELSKPIKVGNTRIFSLAAGSGKVGRIEYKIRDNSYHYSSFSTVNLGKKYKNSKAVSNVMKKIEKIADKNYYAANGFSSGQVLCDSFFGIASISENDGKKQDSPMGELIADAYIYSTLLDAKIPKGNFIGVASKRSEKGSIKKGRIRVNDVYRIMKGGRSSNKTKGRALTMFYMKGEDVRKLAEISAISYKDDTDHRYYFSGLNYKYNPHRFKESRVYDINVFEDDMSLGIKLSDDTLYKFVTDTGTAKTIKELETYEDKDLRIKLLNESGKHLNSFEELKRFTDAEAGEKSNYPLKSWAAMASYLTSFKESGISASYRRPDGRMVYDDSKALSHVYKGEGFTLFTMLVVALIGVVALVVLILLILNLAGVKRIGKKHSAPSHLDFKEEETSGKK